MGFPPYLYRVGFYLFRDLEERLEGRFRNPHQYQISVSMDKIVELLKKEGNYKYKEAGDLIFWKLNLKEG